MVKIKHISFAYPAQPDIFTDFNLEIIKGTSLAIIGPSGCGKSTLLYLLSGLIKTVSGQITIDGFPLQRPRPQTGLVLQDHGLLPWATVWDNAVLGLKIRRFYGPDGKHAPLEPPAAGDQGEDIVNYWLKRLEIDDLRGKYPSQLSRGQRQRTAIARSLAMSPDLLLMDEPFSALDAAIRSDLQKTMMNLHRERGMTTVVVTHDIGEALFVGEQILVINKTIDKGQHVLENRFAGHEKLRNTPGFQRLFERLRGMLERSP